MTSLTQTSNPEGMKLQGHPILWHPKRNESKGLVLMQHGFTAAPFFYYKIWGPLLDDGWDVMLPMFPGHGRQPTVRANGSSFVVEDWVADLPTRGHQYEAYAEELMKIAQEYKDEHPRKQMILAGVSHGGALAAYMAMRMKPGTWNRVLLMNPFFAPPTAMGADFGLSFLRYIVPQVLPLIGMFNDRFGWGIECEALSWPGGNFGGTGGLCQFSPSAMRGVLEFANNVEGEARSRAAKHGVFTGGLVDRAWGLAEALKHWAWTLITGNLPPPSNMNVQIITTENDGAISNHRLHFAAAALSKALQPGNFSFCALPEEMQHT